MPTTNGILTPSEKAYLAAALSISFDKYQKQQNKKSEHLSASLKTDNLEFIFNEFYGMQQITPNQNKLKQFELDQIKKEYTALEKDAKNIRAIMIRSNREITDMEL